MIPDNKCIEPLNRSIISSYNKLKAVANLVNIFTIVIYFTRVVI